MTDKENMAEVLAKSAGVPVDLTKNTFVLTKATLFKLIMNVADGEYVRGYNSRLCAGCEKLHRSGFLRKSSEPDKVFDFCEGCKRANSIKQTNRRNPEWLNS